MIEIKASENFITPGVKLELVAVRQLISRSTELVKVSWTIAPVHDSISLINNILLVKPGMADVDEISVSCTEDFTGASAHRIFKISRQIRHGKLVHFIKHDHNYCGDNFTWDLWTYESDKQSIPVAFSGHSDFGVTAFSHNKYIIARKLIWDHSWCNEWAEQTHSFELNMREDNYYIIHGDTALYTSLVDVVNKTNPRIQSAIMDENIRAYLSHSPLPETSFELYINSHKQENAICTHEDQHLIISNLPNTMRPSDLVVIKASQTFSPCQVLMRNYLDNFYYSNNNLGVQFDELHIWLRIWAPTAIKVELLLYKNYDQPNNQPDHIFTLHNDTRIHYIQIHRQTFDKQFYLYRLHFNCMDNNNQPGIATTYAVDPYANSLAINGTKGCLINLDAPETMPVKWHESQKPKNSVAIIIYEMHMRDFTIASSANNKFPGKFLGLSERGTCFIDAKSGQTISTGLDSLIELGITHVHLLPVFDFASIDETKLHDVNNRNWGYDPRNYNVPTGAYSTNPYDPYSRIREFREMIYQLHQYGIKVIIDVVYNHMADTINFDNIVNGYYFRSDNYGNFTNGSGCGNELASERPQVRKFILDSILHWVRDYKIDGLRFDLMELIDIDTMKLIVKKVHEIDPAVLIYGEPWRAGDTPLMFGTYRGSQKNENFSIFNDYFRNAIRGNNNPGHGFINGNQHHPDTCWSIIEGLKGSIHTLTANPQESINYVDAHDNYTLWDHIKKSYNFTLKSGEYQQHIDENNLFNNILIRQNLLAIGIILTAQGIPFLHSGTEILRSKRGDHNSYKSGDLINAINWQDKARFKPVFDYIKGLILLRKTHPAFQIMNRSIIENNLNITTAYNDDKSGVILAHFSNNANQDSWKDIIVIYNATSIDNYPVNQFLPVTDSQIWHIVADHEQAGIKTLASYLPQEVPPLKSYSMLIIHS